MAAFFFYNNRKPRKFNYRPILYDPEEEARQAKLEQRIKAVKREMGILPMEEDIENKNFKEQFISQTKHLKKRKERIDSGKSTNISNNGLLIVVAVILIAITIAIFRLLR